jgi:hypothetical protein
MISIISCNQKMPYVRGELSFTPPLPDTTVLANLNSRWNCNYRQISPYPAGYIRDLDSDLSTLFVALPVGHSVSGVLSAVYSHDDDKVYAGLVIAEPGTVSVTGLKYLGLNTIREEYEQNIRSITTLPSR